MANLKFMFYREFVKLTFYLNSKLNRSYQTIFFPEICILKIFWKMGMKFIKGWQQQGNLSWHCFIILYQSAYISFFFFSVCHNIFYHMNMHYTYSSSLFYYSLWCSKENFTLFTINQSFDCLCIFLVCKISLIENQSLAPLCLRIIVVLFLLYISIIVLMNII